jgi:glycosyltransferase involved in cell wall biosynthesis
MINVTKFDDDGILPVSIIVPLAKKRREFFNNLVLPLLEANMTAEIIINDDEGSAPKKRNDGFKKSTQPFLFFCDDDIILPANYISSLYDVLKKNPDVGFAYTGYHGIVLHPETHPMHGNFEIPAIEFNAKALEYGNYISTMTLVRRELFPMFDENLKRLQDYDLWLTVIERGSKGILVPSVTFYAYYLDSGITSNTNSEIDAMNAIRVKHKF